MKLSNEFFLRKQEAVKEELVRRNWDALVMMNPLSIYYTMGNKGFHLRWERPVFGVISLEHDPVLMVANDVYGHSEGKSLSPVVKDVRPYNEYPYSGPMTTMEWAARMVEDMGLKGKTIGVEDNFIPIQDGACPPWYNQIAKAFRGTTHPAGDLVADMRMIKDEEEIPLVRKACHYADLMVQTISELIEPGLTDEEVATRARQIVEGRMYEELDDIVPSLSGGRLVGGSPYMYAQSDLREERVFRPGVPIIINCGATVGGYHGESERCGIIGDPTPRQQELFEIAMDCEIKARDAVKAGVTCGEVDQVAKDIVTGAGFKYWYGVGHGVGLLGHEPPWVREHNPMPLQPGMCITIEPGLHVPEEGSFHCSETVLVTEDGCEILTPYDGIHRIDLP